ncbi:MAG: baseplate J/gp47 family protein, partial [Burkholderiaceae bacterium]|nr:baseplate J/gp47 family protein [Burkholderiaceae bacterium]
MTSPLNVPIPSIEELAQNTARLLQQQLAQSAQTAMPEQLSATDLDLARSNVAALAFVQAAGLHGAYRYLRDFIARQAIPTQATEEFLDGWLETYGMARKAASAAMGIAGGSGVSGSILPVGTLMQAADGRQYRVTADAVVSGGLVTAPFVALVPGVVGNLTESTALQLLSPVTGVDSSFNVPLGASGGADSEADEDAVSAAV